jgi:predicted AlkP superfamily pyrophosphatase or phosphodiesterase
MKKLSLFIFIDALGWEILQNHSFLDELVPYRSPLESIFGYSSTCDPTIITGKLPREHRHFSFFYYDPPNSPFKICKPLGFVPKSITRRGRVRRIISRLVKRAYRYTGYFQLYNMPFDKLDFFDYSEKKDIYQPGGINGGQPTIFDYFRENDIPFSLSDWRLSEEDNLSALTQQVKEGNISCAYLYMAAMDATLHTHGTKSELVTKKIQWYEDQIKKLLKQAEGNYNNVAIYIFSDHGMTDIHSTCDLMARIEPLGLKFGQDYAAVYDSTMARFWFLNDSARDKITKALEQESMGHIMSEEEQKRYGCDFSDHVYGELFFLLDPGVLLLPSFMGESPMAGMHGYTPDDKDTSASFLTNVKLANPPKRLDDLYDTMRNEMS